MATRPKLADAVDLLRGEEPLLDEQRCWRLDGQSLCLRSNRQEVLDLVGRYMQGFGLDVDPPGSFAPLSGAEPIVVEAYESAVVDLERSLGLQLVDWPRETGKSGRKDAWCDLLADDGVPARVVHKIRTGMTFLQQKGMRIASGPCLRNDNQLINFINAQWMSEFQKRGAIIGHAAALVRENKAVAIAGLSGGGKSTLMLRLLGQGGAFLSNDRIFVSQSEHGARVSGIAKWPRVNPGTIVHDENLHSLMEPAERERFLAMPPEQLREVEQKYDAVVPEIYGVDKVQLNALLESLVILNWNADSVAPTALSEVSLRDELLAALMKSPGPFYQQADGMFWPPLSMQNIVQYRESLQGCRIFELTGRIDFDAAARLCSQ